MNTLDNLIQTQNIGQTHPMFNHNIKPEFTQVLVIIKGNEQTEDIIVGQFFGAMAKQFASRFVQKLKG